MSLQYLLKTVDSVLFPKLHVIYVFFFLYCRMDMLDLCCHAMMLKLAMILALTPSKPGSWTVGLPLCL